MTATVTYDSADTAYTELMQRTISYATETHGSGIIQHFQGSDIAGKEQPGCYIRLSISIPCSSGTLHAKRGFVMSIWKEEGLYCADDINGLGISEAAPTYGELVASIHDTLTFLWDEYATADNADLNDGAIKLKQRIHKHFLATQV